MYSVLTSCLASFRYYVESILQLQGSQTVELFYQQARSLVYKVRKHAIVSLECVP
ncbi:hypothetical protein E2C01_074467 [Portunus trituberculatus]|uniref:Uncharacterized protein n=1 Tax=Portunus trituberculatus TaxID=210409 RepID=A0A5B7I3E9_PORTR|nr:hypothetical protein [Portunus trituberculatus]